jgi:hypothetical protein
MEADNSTLLYATESEGNLSSTANLFTLAHHKKCQLKGEDEFEFAFTQSQTIGLHK